MAAEEKKMKTIQIYVRTLFLVSLWCIALFLVVWAVWEKDGFIDYWNLQDQKASILEEKALLKDKNRELSRRVQRLQEDRAYMEAVAMEQLKMIPLNARIYLFGEKE